MHLHYLPTLFLLIALQLLSKAGYGQQLYNQTPEFLNGNSIWAFSNAAGLNFNGGTATPITTQMPNTGFGEGAAAVCDRNTGDLLFYTDGATVWNANGQPMPNGSGLYGNGGGVKGNSHSTRQGVVIVPFVDDVDRYYIFSLNNVDANSTATSIDDQVFIDNNGDTMQGSLFYSVVDMTLESGLGNVVDKNILVDTTALSEAMIAIPGLCGNVWLLVHSSGPPEFNSIPQYKAYEITSSGINTTPILSSGKVNAMQGFFAVSPDRSKIALAGGGRKFGLSETDNMGLEVGRFDPSNGMISQVVHLISYDSFGTFGAGCVFSPNSQYLYYENSNLIDTSYITKCDLTTFDSAAILASRINIASTPNDGNLPELLSFANGYRLYNDTIYIVGAYNGNTLPPYYYISRIANPNNPGANCGYEAEAILLLPNTYPKGATLGSETVYVPISDTVTNTQDALICEGWQQGIILSPEHSNGMYYTWSDNSTDSVLTINQGGTYWVNYYTEDCSLFYSDTFNITEGNIVEPVITVNGHVLSTTLTYSTYQWLLNDVAINGATQQDYTVQENGFYRVVVTNEQGCVDTSDAYEVTNVSINDVHYLAQQIQVWPNPVKDEVFVRAPVPVCLRLTTISGKVIQQQLESNSLSLRKLTAGMYLLRISAKDGRLIKVKKLIKAKE